MAKYTTLVVNQINQLKTNPSKPTHGTAVVISKIKPIEEYRAAD
jgi:hypothetical protein